MLQGVLAASVTPLSDGGRSPDESGIAAVLDFLAAAGLDGVLALGTTGEGILLSPDERRRVLERFADASSGRLSVAVNCGAQTTADTVDLAAHAAGVGVDAVAVIGPPYYALDEDALLAHFAAAARACAPTPFYLYEFADRTGYPVPPAVIERLRDAAPNLAGLKVSDAPFERFAPYLLEGLDVFVGPEALIHEGLQAGAVGAVSGLAAAFPEAVAALVREPTEAAGARVGSLRASLQRFPFQAALKQVLIRRGVAIETHVRTPLRALTDDERAEVEQVADAELSLRAAVSS